MWMHVYVDIKTHSNEHNEQNTRMYTQTHTLQPTSELGTAMLKWVLICKVDMLSGVFESFFFLWVFVCVHFFHHDIETVTICESKREEGKLYSLHSIQSKLSLCIAFIQLLDYDCLPWSISKSFLHIFCCCCCLNRLLSKLDVRSYFLAFETF